MVNMYIQVGKTVNVLNMIMGAPAALKCIVQDPRPVALSTTCTATNCTNNPKLLFFYCYLINEIIMLKI